MVYYEKEMIPVLTAVQAHTNIISYVQLGKQQFEGFLVGCAIIVPMLFNISSITALRRWRHSWNF